MTRVVITGAKGRMGQALISCAARFPELQVTGQVDVGDDIKAVIDNCDVVIDFSFHNATASVAQLCAAKGK
ncbi:MAG TPA: 4-hydroxy-tetrahydrodipicolinate reductase, partial [Verrucomicrobiae bacterium]|nr:4-hydroxy-tetrahydrodipicolinate reductase [Verrucomicrobiae bacterium]